MKKQIQLTSMIPIVRTTISPPPRWRGFLLIALTLASIELSQTMLAVTPPPDGGYPGNNTAEGDSALYNLTSGTDNTAIGYEALASNGTGYENTATGAFSLLSNDIGYDNTAIGYFALLYNSSGFQNTATGSYALFYNDTGSNNTANGEEALYNNTTGAANTAIGFAALASNTTGSYNTANGEQALVSNTTGDYNTADGSRALYGNTTGRYNTAAGYEALYSNSTGGSNSAHGYAALVFNTTGSNNAANGFAALYHNTTGSNNTANGANALLFNTTGTQNTGTGVSALYNNSTGLNNTAEGYFALQTNTTGNSNTALGNNALLANTTGGSNIAVGDAAGSLLTSGSNNIDIGNKGAAGEANTIRIGKKGTQTATYVAGIRGTTAAGGIAVLIDANGRLGTSTSSARFKDNIEPMDKASESILALKPVTFRYKHELDPAGIPQFGLVAEQVEKVNPSLVARDDQGKPYTVRYEAVNAMLLNEFLKEHRKLEEEVRRNRQQEATISEFKSALAQQKKAADETGARQQKEIELLRTSLKAQAEQIQKVSDQFALSKPAPRIAVNNP